MEPTTEDLMSAICRIIWKLDRDESVDGTKAKSIPAKIDRNDIVIRNARGLMETGTWTEHK